MQLPVMLPHRNRIALDNVDHQRVGQATRYARILDPAELQHFGADMGQVQREHRSINLAQRDVVDRQFVHALDAAHLDLLDLEARARSDVRRLLPRDFGQAEEHGDGDKDRAEDADDRPARHALKRRFADRKMLDQPIDPALPLERATAPGAARAPALGAAHARGAAAPYPCLSHAPAPSFPALRRGPAPPPRSFRPAWHSRCPASPPVRARG